MRHAAEAAEAGMRATVPMQARKGRASYLGERSVGHMDPGATSTALIVRALERTVAGIAMSGERRLLGSPPRRGWAADPSGSGGPPVPTLARR